MKKVMYLLTAILLGGMMLASCGKDDKTSESEPTPEPTPAKIKIAYRVSNTNGAYTMQPCFKVNVTYLDANGQEVSERDQTLPWHKVVEVTKPFHAMIEGEYVYDTAQLPTTTNVVFGTRYAILLEEMGDDPLFYYGDIQDLSKAKFLKLMEHNPNKLKFHYEEDFKE